MTRIRRSAEELAEEQRQNRLRMQREARAKIVAAGVDGPLTDPRLIELAATLDAYNACQRRIADLSGQLTAALHEQATGATGRHRKVELFDRVHLRESYAEHVDNVGEARTGRFLKRGTGDWDGFARVDFKASGGRITWVPESALVPA